MESSGISPMGVPPPPPDLIRVFEDFRPTVSLSLSPNLASERDFLRPRKTLTKSMATYLTPKSGRHLPRNYAWSSVAAATHTTSTIISSPAVHHRCQLSLRGSS